MNKIKQITVKDGRKLFNNIVLDATYKAQKKYGFEIGTGMLLGITKQTHLNALIM